MSIEKIKSGTPGVNPRVAHAIERLKAGWIDAVARKAAAKAILDRYKAKLPADLPLDALFDFSVALGTHLATIGPVIPLVPLTKRPATKNGVKDATRKPEVIREWAKQYPNCNWGVTGNIVDVDRAVKSGHTTSGSDTINPLILKHGEPDTYMVTTPTGGEHIYLPDTDPLPNSTDTLGEGIDSRQIGLGYVVAAGSYVIEDKKERCAATGFYRERNSKPKRSVKWLMERVGNYKPSPPRGSVIENAEPTISNEQLAERLALLNPVDFRDQAKWLALAMSCHHATAGHGYWEFKDWCDSDYDYKGNPDFEGRWKSFAIHGGGDLHIESEGGLNDHLKRIGRDDLVATEFGAVTDDADALGRPKDDPKRAARRDRLKGRKLSELDSIADAIWLIHDMIPDGLTVLYGKPKRGKSFVALDVSLCCATGTEFCGEVPGRIGPVIYVAAEGGAAAVRNRVHAWCKARKVDPKSLDDKWLLVDCGLSLNKSESVKLFLEANEGKKVLVILDTLARNMSGDENTAKDMNDLIKGCDLIRSTNTAAVILVHHEGWAAKRIRGSSVLQGAPDAVIRVSRDSNDVITLKAEDMRESDNGRTLYFRLLNGALAPVGAADAGAKQFATQVLAVLRRLHTDSGNPVPHDLWRDAVKSAKLLETDGDSDALTPAARQRWKRTLEHFIDRKMVKRHKGDTYAPVKLAAEVIADNAADDFAEASDDADFGP